MLKGPGGQGGLWVQVADRLGGVALRLNEAVPPDLARCYDSQELGRSGWNRLAVYERYVSTHYARAHAGSFERVAAGYGAVYYDVLPDDLQAPILDFGCGLGEFLAFLAGRGYTRCEGMEVGPEQVAAARARVEAPVHLVEDPLAFLAERPDRYALIAMNYTIEHLPKSQVVPTLKALRAALRPGGSLVVTTDNPNRLSGLLCRYNDFTHEWIYTELSLQQVLDQAGFEGVRLIPPRRPPARSLRSVAGRLAFRAWVGVLKLIYFIERPGDYRPTIFDAPLAAEARRPQA